MGLGGSICWMPTITAIAKKFNSKVFLTDGVNCITERHPEITLDPKKGVHLDRKSDVIPVNKSFTSSREIFKDDIFDHIINHYLNCFQLPKLKVPKGELYFTNAECEAVEKIRKTLSSNFITIEPYHNVGSGSPNRNPLSFEKYNQIIKGLSKELEIVQLSHPNLPVLDSIPVFNLNFMGVCYLLKLSSLFIGNEGGFQNAAAAVDTKSIIVFNSYLKFQYYAYPQHINITTGNHDGCGQRIFCEECEKERQMFDTNIVKDAILNAITWN